VLSKASAGAVKKRKLRIYIFELRKNVGFFENIFDPFLSLEIKKNWWTTGNPNQQQESFLSSSMSTK
jgi:hypothetical protein